MLAAAVRAAADLDDGAVGLRHQVGPIAQRVAEQAAQTARLRHRQTAAFGARAAVHVGHGGRVAEPEARRRQATVEFAHLANRHPAQHQILIDGDTHGAVAVRLRQVAEHAHLLAGEVAQRHGHGGGDVAELLLRPDVRLPPVIELVVGGVQHRHDDRRDAGAVGRHRGDARRDGARRLRVRTRPGWCGFHLWRLDLEQPHRPFAAAPGQRLLVLLDEAVPAELLDHELHAVPLAVLVVAVFLEHDEQRFADAEQLGGRDVVVDGASRLAHQRRAAAGQHGEAALAVRAERRLERQVVDGDRRVVVRAPLERDLELARQRRRQAMTQQEAGDLLRVGGDVEQFVGRRAGKRTGGDVPHRVTARLARRHAGVRQQAHRRFHVVQLDEVQLDVLARRDVTEPARILVGHLGECPELGAGDHPLRDLHAQHRRIVRLALAVGAAQQAEGTPLVGRDLGTLVSLEHDDELVDVGFIGERQPRAAVGIHSLVS